MFDPDLFQHADADDPLIALAAATHPTCAALLADLDAVADLSSTGLWRAGPVVSRSTPQTDGADVRLSVVIPCFDHGEFLVEAVASAERSVPVPWELIIVNDGSTETRTLEVLNVLRAAGYCVVDQDNLGLATARNHGIERARASYILPLDADNRLRTGFIEGALGVLDAHPEVGVVYGDRRDFGLRNLVVDVPPVDVDALLSCNFIDACAVIRKAVWRDCGGYDSGMPAWEDWDLWIGAAERGWQFHHIPVEAFDYRTRPGSMIALVSSAESRHRLNAYIARKHQAFYVRRLAGILSCAQQSANELFQLAREHERLHADAGAALQAQAEALARAETTLAQRDGALTEQQRELERMGGETARLEQSVMRLEQDVVRAARENRALHAERDSLSGELDRWWGRVAFMEGTRAWRLRQRLVDIKSAWRARTGGGRQD